MRPREWKPPQSYSDKEWEVARRVKRAKLFTFLRRIRADFCSPVFQAELATLYRDERRGHPPVPPAQLALATILQAYTGASDDEVIEALVMDRRWQLVLDCLDCERAPFGKGTLVRFRALLIAHDFDRRLIERTVQLAERDGGFGPQALRAALDSSPLWGAGRVEDTYNLLGHALRKALGVIARQQGRGLAETAVDARAALVGHPMTSLKAVLNLDWDDPAQREQALGEVLAALRNLEAWLTGQPEQPEAADEPTAQETLAAARQVRAQDVEEPPDGPPRLRRGVAPDRRISIEEAEMRHGRQSRHQRVDGYKRHALRDLDSALIRAVGLTAANAPEAAVTADLQVDLDRQGAEVSELHIDRAYLSSGWVRDRPPERVIYCKAWPVRNGDRFPKTAFALDWEAGTLRCPNDVAVPLRVGSVVHFPPAACAACPLRARCTTSAHGRSVAIHPDERLLAELRERQRSPTGRAQLRERVAVEHSLAHLGHWQGPRARYCGRRKNLFDLRRAAIVHNLHVLRRRFLAQRRLVS